MTITVAASALRCIETADIIAATGGMTMTQMNPIEPYQTTDDAVGDYRQEARNFLVKSRRYLAEGDLHQASEKGWAAAAWMTKSVADAQGWEYTKHAQFSVVLNNARRITDDARILGMRSIANELHGNFYTRRRFLDADAIGEDIDQIALLLDILEPLTSPERNKAGS